MSEHSDTPTATNLVDLIDQLVEPLPPEPVSMAPQTWGWVALAVILVALLATASYRLWLRRRGNAYRRIALEQLRTDGTTVAQAAAILRRSALVAFPRAQVAGLTGGEWIGFLETTGKEAIDPAVAKELTHLVYAAPQHPVSNGLRGTIEAWLRNHQTERAP